MDPLSIRAEKAFLAVVILWSLATKNLFCVMLPRKKNRSFALGSG